MVLCNVFLLIFVFSHCNGLNILGVFPLMTHSHYILGANILKELANRGHNVTMISTLKQKQPVKNYHEILIEPPTDHMAKLNMFEHEESNNFIFFPIITEAMKQFSIGLFEDKALQSFYESNPSFDLVICEQFFSESHYAFAWKFNAPLIVFTAVGPTEMITDKSGTPTPFTWTPTFVPSPYSPLSFYGRILNIIYHTYFHFYRKLVLYPQQNKLAQKYFPGIPHLDNIIYNVSLFLTNSHPAINPPVPMTSNIIEVGGLQVSPKKLPEDLQKFLDQAKDGVVYFSMGSVLKSKDMSLEQKKMFLNAFASIKEKVLWKFEDENLPDQPPNLLIRKWLPQQEILAHPNVKAFISHGGLLSTIETSFLGVPTIGIPIYGDQPMNVADSVNRGTSIHLSLKELTEEKLKAALNEILNNPRYRNEAKKLSKILNDQPEKPIDRAIYWIEYVHRNRGAPFLRPASLDLSWYQYFGIDILLFIISLLIIPIFIFRRICKSQKRSKKEKSQ